MKFQAFHVNPGEKLKEKDVNNDLSNFMSVFPNVRLKYYSQQKKSIINLRTLMTKNT